MPDQDDPKFFNHMFSHYKAFDSGGAVMSLRVDRDDFIAWLEALPVDDKGKVAFDVKTKRTATDANDCYIQRNDWKPTPKQDQPQASEPPADDAHKHDDVPF